MLRTAVLVSDGGANLQAVIDAQNMCAIRDAMVQLVIGNVTDAQALETAKKAGIKTAVICKKDFETVVQWERAMVMELKKNSIDLVVLDGFDTILSADFVKQFPDRIICVHPSLVPAFCGKGMYGINVHKAALARGVKVTGATVYFVDETVCGGEIIAQKAVEVLRGDTAEKLQKRVSEKAETAILPRAIQTVAEDAALSAAIGCTTCMRRNPAATDATF